MTEQKKPQAEPAPEKKVEPPAPATVEWHSMKDAPQDGTYIYLTNGTEVEECFYYWTRQFRKGTWQAVGWWRRRFGPKLPDAFQPTGWRKLNEGLAA